jgi:hypothetical protein
MPCNCGKAKNKAVIKPAPKPPPRPASGTTQTFALEQIGGRVQTFGSLLEAQAAQIRYGGRLML